MSELDETLAAPDSESSMSLPAPPMSERLAERYRIEGLLGVGGMGRVYRAYDEELGERVALKVLRPELLGSADALDRFRQEVKLARRVTHPNVARIFDIGEHAGQRFMTMELIDGAPLSELLAARGALPEAEGLGVFADICAGVAAAHEQGIVHRDLKPSNVMIETSGRVVVTDFGLARGGFGAPAPGEAAASIGQLVGTPAYMSPEQASARPAGPPADVYALGLILFELLSGRPVWQGSSPLLVAARRVMEDAPPLREAYPAAAPALVLIVARCLARQPEARYADATALRDAVETLRQTQMTPLPSVGVLAGPASTPLRPRTAAVLPFTTRRSQTGGGLEDASVGLVEDLCDVLSMTPGLRLRHYHGASVADPLACGRELGVDVVIVGSVRARGELLRVNVRVIGVADGFQLWAGRFERSVGEALALNDEVGQGVAQALSVADPAARPTIDDREAVEIYLQLRAATNAALMAGGHTPELDVLLARALEVAPDNPLVLATWLGSRGWSLSIFAGPWVTPEIEARLHKVLAAAPELAASWHAKAAVEFYGHRQAAAAVVSLRRALAINPGHVDARALLAFILLEAGMFDEVAEHGQRVLWSDPTNSRLRVTMMHLHAMRGQWDRVTALVESLDTPRWRKQANIAAARYSWWAGRWLGTPFDKLPAYTDEGRSIGLSHRVFTRAVESRDLMSEGVVMLARAAPGSRATVFLRQIFAEGAAYLGDHELALRYVTEAEAHGIVDAAWLPHNPLLAEVRARPEAQPLLASAAARAAEIRAAYEAET